MSVACASDIGDLNKTKHSHLGNFILTADGNNHTLDLLGN